jgi:hypothetical protein
MAAACSRCGNLMRSRDDQVEVRVEYRSVVSLRRLRTWRRRMICRGCALAEWEAHDRPGSALVDQERLW